MDHHNKDNLLSLEVEHRPMRNVSLNCSICAGNCYGKSYGVIGCESCKQFFRRVVLRRRLYLCKQGPECAAGKGKNLKCRGCRLDKCLLVGMNPSFISLQLNSEQKHFLEKLKKRADSLKQQSAFDFQITNSATSELSEFHLLDGMLLSEQLARYISDSSTIISAKHYQPFKSLEELVGNRFNLLAYADEFQKNSFILPGDNELVSLVKESGVFGFTSPYFVKDLLICMNLGKTLPAFTQIEIFDQMKMIKHGIHATVFFLLAFWSSQKNSETILFASDNPIVKMFMAGAKYYKSEFFMMICQKQNEFLVDFLNLKLHREEAMLIFALLFTNPATPGLSEHAKTIFHNKEHTKYAELLLKWQRATFGETAAPVRYMQTLGLLTKCINFTQKSREYGAHIECVYEQGKLLTHFPVAMLPLFS